MTTLKITTAKSGNDAVIIDNAITVVRKGENYFIYPNVANGKPCADQSGTEVFIEAYNNHLQAIAAKKHADEEIAKEKEALRIKDLKERISKCETPKELAEEFGLSTVELANHWSDLYENRSRLGILISTRAEDEIMSLAIDIHNADGDYGEARHRAGEQHNTFSGPIYSLDDYQQGLKRHFAGDNFFYKSQETEAEFMMERIKECDTIDEVAAIVKEYEELESGYYDCNGNMEMPEATLESKDITGYSYDVYNYNFCYRLNVRYNNWKENEETENDEE